jgi:2-keto-4-pentenoate hydratase/2-oxohepta-3-ene-1,7-dioic acid hydratase in catechol pathway
VSFTGERVPLADVRLLAPMIPSKVVAIGKNYADHAREMGGEAPASPVLFMKPSTAVCGPGDPIQRPAGVQRLDFEGELAGRHRRLARDVPVSRGARRRAGLHLRQRRHRPRTSRRPTAVDARQGLRHRSARSGRGSRPISTPATCRSGRRLNGDTRQDSTTALLLHDVPTLISYVTAVMTLLPGDIVLTGTPAGVGPMVAGDEVSVTGRRASAR